LPTCAAVTAAATAAAAAATDTAAAAPMDDGPGWGGAFGGALVPSPRAAPAPPPTPGPAAAEEAAYGWGDGWPSAARSPPSAAAAAAAARPLTGLDAFAAAPLDAFAAPSPAPVGDASLAPAPRWVRRAPAAADATPLPPARLAGAAAPPPAPPPPLASVEPLPAVAADAAGPRPPRRKLTLPTTAEPAADVRRAVNYWATCDGYEVSGETPAAHAARLADAAAMARRKPPGASCGGGSVVSSAPSASADVGGRVGLGGGLGGGAANGGGGGVGVHTSGAPPALEATALYQAAADAWVRAGLSRSADHLKSLTALAELHLARRRLRAAASVGAEVVAALTTAAALGEGDPATRGVALGGAHFFVGKVAAEAGRPADAIASYRAAMAAYADVYAGVLAAVDAPGGGVGEAAAALRRRVKRLAAAVTLVLSYWSVAAGALGEPFDLKAATARFGTP